MSEDAQSTPPRQQGFSMAFKWFVVCVVLVMFSASGFIAFLEPPFSAMVFLAIGRILSGWRMVQGIDDFQNLWWWLLGCIVLVVLLNAFVRSVLSGKHRRWRLQSSLAALGICWMALFAGMSLAGAVHQAGWLLGSDEPRVRSRSRRNDGPTQSELRSYAVGMARLLQEYRTGEAWLERWNTECGHLVNYVVRVHSGADGVIRSLSIWPRSTSAFHELGGHVVNSSGTITREPYEGMQALMTNGEQSGGVEMGRRRE